MSNLVERLRKKDREYYDARGVPFQRQLLLKAADRIEELEAQSALTQRLANEKCRVFLERATTAEAQVKKLGEEVLHNHRIRRQRRSYIVKLEAKIKELEDD